MPPEKISITRVKKYYLFLHSSTENGDKQKKKKKYWETFEKGKNGKENLI